MRTRVSSKGQIVLPAELRQQDAIEAGQEFEVERLEARRVSAEAMLDTSKRRYCRLAADLSREGLLRADRIRITDTL